MDTDTPQIAAPDIFLLVSVIPLGDAHPGTPWHKKILALPAPLCLSGIVDTSISSKNVRTHTSTTRNSQVVSHPSTGLAQCSQSAYTIRF